MGANDGATALALNEAFPGRQFFLFEPAPQTFAVLVGKTENYKNMHCLMVAAGAKEEKKTMRVD